MKYSFFVEDIVKMQGVKELRVLVRAYNGRSKRKVHSFTLPISMFEDGVVIGNKVEIPVLKTKEL